MTEFETLYDEYVEFVWRIARQLGTSDAALDDVVQDVFLVVHRKLDDVTSPEQLRAWLYSIVIRVVRDYRRRTRRKEPHLRAVGEPIQPDELADTRTITPLTSAEQSDAVRTLYLILGELDDAKREAFVLAELEEMTEAEIAHVLGENVNTVHSRLRAARKEFDQAVLRHRSRDEWRLR
jgi:RNA polymerase sigma-70 factor (ECF subfamily)